MKKPGSSGECRGGERSIIGGGGYSNIRVHRLLKQSITKEINCAEHEYMNMGPPIIELALPPGM